MAGTEVVTATAETEVEGGEEEADAAGAVVIKPATWRNGGVGGGGVQEEERPAGEGGEETPAAVDIMAEAIDIMIHWSSLRLHGGTMVEAIEDIRRSTRRSSLVGGLGKIKEVSIFHFREMPFLFI